VAWLFQIIQRLKNEGVCILYISHRIAEVRQLCDKISVLRNGENVGTFNINEVTNSQIIDKMLGHHLEQARSYEERRLSNQVILSVEHASRPPDLDSVDLNVYEGEVLGVAGLAGQGQMDFFRILFGIEQSPSCQITIGSQEVKIGSPIDAIKAGIVFLPAERNNNTMFYGLPTSQNMSISILDLISRNGWLNQNQEQEKVRSISKSLNINLDQIRNKISSLSGGNQQKALLGKWLLTNARIFLLFDPTRGVDIGTKFEIIKLVSQMAKSGKTIIYYSTDIDELVDLADRVIVFYQGRICDTFTRKEINSEKILQAVTGIK
jgi:ribose transport system ATP-binding protein